MAGGGGGFAACWPQRWVNFKARYLLGCVLLPGCATSLFLELEMCRTEKQQLILKKRGKKALEFQCSERITVFLVVAAHVLHKQEQAYFLVSQRACYRICCAWRKTNIYFILC